MNDNSFCIRRWHLAVSVLLLLAFQTVFAGNAPHVSPSSSASSVSGSYKVTQNTPLGSQTRLQMRIHLANHGSSALVFSGLALAQGTINTYAGNDALFEGSGQPATSG